MLIGPPFRVLNRELLALAKASSRPLPLHGVTLTVPFQRIWGERMIVAAGGFTVAVLAWLLFRRERKPVR